MICLICLSKQATYRYYQQTFKIIYEYLIDLRKIQATKIKARILKSCFFSNVQVFKVFKFCLWDLNKHPTGE